MSRFGNYTTRSQRGTTMLEATLSLSFFFFAFFTFFTYAVFLLRSISLQSAVNSTMRWVSIENITRSGTKVIRMQSYSNAEMKAHIIEEARKVKVDLVPDDIKICVVGTPCPPELVSTSVGAVYKISVVKPFYAFGLVKLKLMLSASGVGRTEGRL